MRLLYKINSVGNLLAVIPNYPQSTIPKPVFIRYVFHESQFKHSYVYFDSNIIMYLSNTRQEWVCSRVGVQFELQL